MGTASIECDRILTDQDFKMIKHLRKKQAEDQAAKNNPRTGAAPAIHMPEFNFLEERTKLKSMTQKMQREFEEDHRKEYHAEKRLAEMVEENLGAEEAGDEEDDGDEEGFERMDEEDLEELDGEEEDDGDEEGDEEDDGDEEEIEIGEDEGEIIEEADFEKIKSDDDDDSDMVGSSFYDESDSQAEFNPSAGFLQSSSILNRDTFKRKVTKDQIKIVKAEQREEHKALKVGAKIKQRGRMTNRQKQKNNPYQMFIQKKRLQNRLTDMKAEMKKKKNSRAQKGHQRSNRLGKGKGKKF